MNLADQQLARLPAEARLKLLRLDDLARRALAGRAAFQTQENDARHRTRTAEQRVQGHRARFPSAPIPADMADELTLAREDEARIQAAAAEAGDQAAPAGFLVNHLVAFLQDLDREHRLVRCAGPAPKLGRGRHVLDELDQVRQQITGLQADIADLEYATVPLAVARERAVAEIEALASRGAPDVAALFDQRPGSIAWPKSVQRMSGGTSHVAGELVDPLALFAWIHKPALVKAVTAEIERHGEPEGALTPADHAARQSQMAEELLQLERFEESLVAMAEGARIPVQRRPDADPRAVLELAIEAAGAAQAA